jgi:hemolysin activation/secretion protein
MSYLPEADLMAILEPYKNRNLTLEQIQEASGKVAMHFRRNGYPAIQVYIPEQDASNGVVILKAIVAKFAPSHFENQSLVSDWFIKGMVAATLKEGELVTRKKLERLVLLTNDLPGAGMSRLTMGPGPDFGTTEFLAQVPRGKRIGGFLMSDNNGSIFTGRTRFMAGIDVNSPFNLGDKLSVFGFTTENQGMSSVSLTYEFPVGYSGARVGLNYGYVYYELGEDFDDLDITGNTKIVDVYFKYPIIRTASRNLYLNLNFAHKEMTDNLAFYDLETYNRNIVGKVSLVNEYWGKMFGKMFFNKIGASVTYGNIKLRENGQAALDPRGVEGDFSYGNLEFVLNVGLTEKLGWNLTASFQKAFGKNLDPSEQFILTTSTGVRAYRESLSADNGYLLTTEFRYSLPNIASAQHAIGLFYDHGGWWMEKEPYGGRRSSNINDVGLGYYLNFPHFALRAHIVRALGSFPEEITKKEPETYGSFTLILYL